jgi:DNA-directed RNA polymerase I subunit RPA1
VNKYNKSTRDAHSKYAQYLRSIDIDDQGKHASVSIAFPLDFKKVLMLNLVDQTLARVLVRSVAGIEKCTLNKPKKEGEEPFLVVQGLNFDAFYPHQDIIDVNRIETNHSYALMAKYGVEAMRANIVKEVQMVFGIYGIAVDSRHLSLISDFMTFNGDYRAFNRIGMEESSSPFLKMSYETTMKYLVSASMANETDNMSTPSSAIVMGQVPRVGTNMFDLV